MSQRLPPPALLCLLLGLILGNRAVVARPCQRGPLQAIDSHWYVVDGDTLHLDDGRKLRLIGIDTPEIFHDGRPPEPYALEARKALIQLLREQRPLSLQAGRQRRDHYGRLLVHLFSGEDNIEAELLRQGLATALYIPPNYRYAGCYAAAENEARRQGLGLWSLPRYQAVAATRLPAGSRGFHVVRGRITRIGHSRDSLWLNLTPAFALRLLNTDLGYFQDPPVESLRDRTVIVRGWIYARSYHGHRQLRMRLRHPAQLDVLPLHGGGD